ncbi:uncharacterized protein UDID_18681 [Ustilago sp. UG-2017a]|nr:uncharacterized protein UDID_18681 [Ustilago sp. UG-2017a]
MQIPTYDFTNHLREHDLVLGAKSLLHQPDLVSKASTACKYRDDWISWVQSITPSPPPPAAMLSIQSAAQEEINVLMAQVVADAEEQVAGQVGRSVLRISSTGATQEASPANLFCPVLSTGRHSCSGQLLMVHNACPFCAQDESLSAEQRSRVWHISKLANHIAGVHLFNMSSSPTTCLSCGKAMPIKELALHLDLPKQWQFPSKDLAAPVIMLFPLPQHLVDSRVALLRRTQVIQPLHLPPSHIQRSIHPCYWMMTFTNRPLDG